MKLKLLLLAAVCALALSGCTPMESNVENLMRSPKLTDLQTQVDSALREAVGRDFLLKYPSRGEYRSALNFLDVNGDGVDEAIAFLSTQEDSLQLALLRQDSGSWLVSDLIPAHNFCTEVDFMELRQLGRTKRLLVGWGGTGRENNFLTIYNYDSGSSGHPTLTLDSRWDYSQLVVNDLDRDGLDELLLFIVADSYDDIVPSAQLVGENSDGILDLLAETELARNVVSFYPPVVGSLGSGLYGAVADARLGNGKYCTIAVTYTDGVLQLPLSGLIEGNLFKQTIRNQAVLSCDLNKDGTVEIPVERPAVGYLQDAPDAVYFIDYCNLEDREAEDTAAKETTKNTPEEPPVSKALVPVQSAYCNLARGYRLLLPEVWREHPVSVLVQPDNSEAVFFINSSDNLYDHSKELLRIQVRSTLDVQDKQPQGRQFQLAAKGTYLYFASLPLDLMENLALTRDQVKNLFTLIN